MAQIKITWTKSCIGRPGNQEKVIQALGLKRLNHTVTHGDTPTIRGMVNKVSHLLTIEDLAEEEKPAPRRTRRPRKADAEADPVIQD